IAGHKDVEGSEVVDRKVKLVAKGKARLSPRNKLPTALREQLPHSIPALKQDHNKKLKKLWKDKWSILSHFPHLSTINPTLPSNTW
ncbi:hypothetical protein SCLCIDRAFT_58931, partial [Scleroderma citrinum Foug A]